MSQLVRSMANSALEKQAAPDDPPSLNAHLPVIQSQPQQSPESGTVQQHLHSIDERLGALEQNAGALMRGQERILQCLEQLCLRPP